MDQYFWLQYRNAARVQKRFPPNLPNYLLDIKQWYPPFFGWFLSVLPNRLFKYSNLITQLLSITRLSFLIAVAFFLNIEMSAQLFLVIILYLTAPILIYYDNQINSRIFGAILVDILILLFWGYFEYQQDLLLVPILLLTTLLLFTHKMSHQLYVFLLIGMSFFYMNVIPIITYALSTLIGIFFFNYSNYLKAHIEIVKFWHRHRYQLGAHQFYDSGIYGKKDFFSSNKLHGRNIKFTVKKIALILGMFPFILFIFFNLELNYFGLIIVTTFIFILLTSFFNFMFCLGAGYYYVYNLVTAIGFYLLLTPIEYSIRNQILLLMIFVMTILSLLKYSNGLKHQKDNSEFKDALEFLINSHIDRLLILPFLLADEVSFKTNKKVFWGGHGYGFLWVEPYYPVFNEKIEHAIHDWNLGAILLMKSYFHEFSEKVNMNLFNILYENNQYILLSVKHWTDKEQIPDWAIQKYPELWNKEKCV